MARSMQAPNLDESSGRRSDARANDEKVVRVARRLAAKNGGLPSMQAIADAAEVGLTTLYRRFPTKERLASHIQALDFCDQLVPAFEQALADPDSRHAMRSMTLNMANLASRFMDPQRGMTVSPVDLLDAYLDRFLPSMVQLMRQAKKSRALRADIEEADIPRLCAILLGGLVLPGRFNDAPERYIALIFEGLERKGSMPLPPLPPPIGF
ncbi:MAG: TetR/AcrR family transcriptional regulator [Edaphobacter sp.]|uniref:TetR/AcrR family transcriptional regulator n=1 Tax=Edaphobacter sp. TaxID=1934404 RepID=UPI002384E2D9|nr:TetR/AcrR family transcriptional regulator [Edaphobacter sp.]MDE1178302.1 TetR/AcrR family transcriptional regulator [Edaphobacter sp.]